MSYPARSSHHFVSSKRAIDTCIDVDYSKIKMSNVGNLGLCINLLNKLAIKTIKQMIIQSELILHCKFHLPPARRRPSSYVTNDALDRGHILCNYISICFRLLYFNEHMCTTYNNKQSPLLFRDRKVLFLYIYCTHIHYICSLKYILIFKRQIRIH